MSPYLASMRGVRPATLRLLLLVFTNDVQNGATVAGDNVRVEVADHKVKDFESFCRTHSINFLPAR